MHHSSIEPLLQELVTRKGSDLYLTVGYPPSVRTNDVIEPVGSYALEPEEIQHMLREIIAPDKLEEFEATFELNTAILWNDTARFRINLFKQQQQNGMVIRRIETDIPTIASLGLPAIYEEIILEKRGLILIVGPTGSGKSTSLAAMIGHRNQHGSGHIVTVEDPIEFVHAHKRCIVTQRDIGIDTYSFGLALKNVLRQRPDVVLIGEIRDSETMEHAINFAETGHLCVATLHANNSNQTIERIVNFFPEEKHRQILLNLSLNLRGVLSQRLIPTRNNKRMLALEIMLNRGLIKTLIEEGKVKEIKEIIEKSREQGMQTFDQSLLGLYQKNVITEDVALAESDNSANLRLQIRQLQTSQKLQSERMIINPASF